MRYVQRTLHRHRVALLTGSIGLAALLLTWALVLTEIRSERLPVNWPAFAIIAALLLWCERSAATWIRFGSAGVVTPLGMFAFGLMLVGSPSYAGLGLCLMSTVKVSMLSKKAGTYPLLLWKYAVQVFFAEQPSPKILL